MVAVMSYSLNQRVGLITVRTRFRTIACIASIVRFFTATQVIESIVSPVTPFLYMFSFVLLLSAALPFAVYDGHGEK